MEKILKNNAQTYAFKIMVSLQAFHDTDHVHFKAFSFIIFKHSVTQIIFEAARDTDYFSSL